MTYTGPIKKAGWYSIMTQSGSIRLTLPEQTSCTLSAVYAFGTLTMDFPAKPLTEDVATGAVKKRNFQLGGAQNGATVKLQTTSGNIWVKKEMVGPGFGSATAP